MIGIQNNKIIETIDKIQPQIETSQKMTKVKLYRLLNELGLQYSIDGEGNKFKIVINLPQGYIIEKKTKLKTHFVNDACYTVFDKEKIVPLIHKINLSTNLRCVMSEMKPDQYIISVFKK